MIEEKVSVVIPTRNRSETVGAAIRSALNQTYRNIEIVVSNNGGDPATRAVVDAIDNPRIRYVEPPKPLSMSHNFEFGMEQATGDWLVLIGDDDGIMPSGIQRGLEILSDAGSEALGSNPCHFRWPIGDQPQRGAYLTVPKGRGWVWRDSQRVMQRILARDLDSYGVPVTYTGGIVSARLFNRIKAVKGSFYQSQIPDTFSAFAFLSSVKRYVYCKEPLMISGVSAKSHGTAGLSLAKNPFNADDNIPFHSNIPLPEEGTFTFSYQALLYESYLQTAYLRKVSDLTTFEEQIVAIAAYAEWYIKRMPDGLKAAEATRRWIRSAALSGGLDPDKVARKATALTVPQKLSYYRQKFGDFLERYVIDESLGLPIQSVYQASLVAETIHRLRPSISNSRIRSVLRKLKG